MQELTQVPPGEARGPAHFEADHSHPLRGCPGSVWLHGYALLDALLVVSVIDFCFFPQTPVDCQLAPFGWMPGLCLAAWLFFAGCFVGGQRNRLLFLLSDTSRLLADKCFRAQE